MSGRSDANGPAILLMVVSMVGFALADTLIKWSSETGTGGAGPGQIIIYQGISGVLLFGGIMLATRERFVRATLSDATVLVRTGSDLLAVACFTTALTRMPVGSASAILQIQPLVVMIGAAVFLREVVTPRRWIAVALGFGGVMMIVRPGMAAFHPASVLVLLAVMGLTVRDLATRVLGAEHSTIAVSALISVAMIPMGLVIHALSGAAVDFGAKTNALLIASSLFAMAAYYAITQAMRLGEVSAVAPFRYSRLVAAFLIAFVVLGERPDAWTLLGSAIIVAAGVWVLTAERRRAG